MKKKHMPFAETEDFSEADNDHISHEFYRFVIARVGMCSFP